MSSSKDNSSQSKGESSGPKSEASGSNADASKITSFFPVLRGNEARAKMCATKTGASKQKEMLQKLKNKEASGQKQKASTSKDQSAKSDSSGPQGREKVSVLSALKTPLSQVLRKSIEAAESKKAATDSSGKKDSPQRAKKSFQVAESGSGRATRHSQASSSSSLRSSIKKNVDSNPSVSTRRRVTLSESGDPKNTFSGRVSACSSPVEDKAKKNRKRHYRGATYSLFLSKKSKKKNLMKRSKDDEGSREGTENSSYLDSEDGNSLMSEDLYTPSEKSLADEEHNTDSRTSPLLVSEQKTEAEDEAKEESSAAQSSTLRNENEDISQNATDMIQEMQWESESKGDIESKAAPQYDDISNESFSNSTTFPFKASPTESIEESKPEVGATEGDGNKPEVVATDEDGRKSEVGTTDEDGSKPEVVGAAVKPEDGIKPEIAVEELKAEDTKGVKVDGFAVGKEVKSEDVPMTLAELESSLMDSIGLDNEESLASRPTSGDENDSAMLDGSDAMHLERGQSYFLVNI